MPRATYNPKAQRRYELKTCPAQGGEEAGFVVLRRLTQGEVMERRSLAGVETEDRGRRRDNSGNRMVKMRFEIEAALLFDFAKCVVEHNLTDEDGRPLDFTRASDVKMLDATIAREIEELIDEVNESPRDDASDPPTQTSSGDGSPTE